MPQLLFIETQPTMQDGLIEYSAQIADEHCNPIDKPLHIYVRTKLISSKHGLKTLSKRQAVHSLLNYCEPYDRVILVSSNMRDTSLELWALFGGSPELQSFWSLGNSENLYEKCVSATQQLLGADYNPPVDELRTTDVQTTLANTIQEMQYCIQIMGQQWVSLIYPMAPFNMGMTRIVRSGIYNALKKVYREKREKVLVNVLAGIGLVLILFGTWNIGKIILLTQTQPTTLVNWAMVGRFMVIAIAGEIITIAALRRAIPPYRRRQLTYSWKLAKYTILPMLLLALVSIPLHMFILIFWPEMVLSIDATLISLSCVVLGVVLGVLTFKK